MDPTIKQLHTELETYKPAIALDAHVPKKVRHFVTKTLQFGAIGSLLLSLYLSVIGDIGLASVIAGIFFLTCTSLISMYFVSFYYNSLYNRGVGQVISETKKNRGGITYEVALICTQKDDDLTRKFVTSDLGSIILLRCGINQEVVRNFLNKKTWDLPMEKLTIPDDRFLNLTDVGTYMYMKDKEFVGFLFEHGVTKETFLGAVAWIARINYEAKQHARWWSRDNLGKVQGLGKSFSFGVAYDLQRYLKNIQTTAVFSTLINNPAYARDQINAMENILARTKGANVIVVGEPGVGKMDLIMQLQQRMSRGTSIDSIEGKQLLVLDTESFIATHNTKQEFEASFLKMFNQAHAAGNIIIVIEHIARFFESVESLGSDAADLMDQYLASPNLQFIATSDLDHYHQQLENRPQLLGRFETVRIEKSNLESTIRVIEDTVLEYERKNNIFFSYQAIEAIVENADRYIVEGVMPDKAVGLLVEVVPYAKRNNETFITHDLIHTYTAEKTGIPIGPIEDEERDTLLNLEEILHKRVVGQNHAIKAISSAMRRSRTNVQSKNRPLGSFLFLGSTGVGKTETAKALAHVFFGDEEKMLRLDMSEFSGPDALSRLLGENDGSGILTNLLREHPYGVLLLDEFEKASSLVHNLFLQILDEGIFSDARGKHVNARNSIIIATSNAGSDMIWKYIESDQNPIEKQEEIINHIVSEGIYKPELINRFDGTIIFEPLGVAHREAIAKLMLEELKKRVREQGYELIVDHVLINLLATKGYSAQFGARPMQRIMQDQIEEKIAEKIIAGRLKLGDKIWFYGEEFEDVS